MPPAFCFVRNKKRPDFGFLDGGTMMSQRSLADSMRRFPEMASFQPSGAPSAFANNLN